MITKCKIIHSQFNYIFFRSLNDRDGTNYDKKNLQSRKVKRNHGGKDMKTNIRKTLFCTTVLAIFVLPLISNSASATSERIFYFDDWNSNIEWETDPENMCDGDPDTYASTTDSSDVQLLDKNNCTGSESGTITGVYIRAKAYYTGAPREVCLTPIFDELDGDDHYFYPPSGEQSADWSDWFDVTDDTNSHSYWTWREVDRLDVNVSLGLGMTGFTVYVSQVEIKVTYT